MKAAFALRHRREGRPFIFVTGFLPGFVFDESRCAVYDLQSVQEKKKILMVLFDLKSQDSVQYLHRL